LKKLKVENQVDDIPLRERKYAQTKLSLLNETIERLKIRRLDDISVKELCQAAVLSEGTFFNYFRKKEDLLVYYIQLWTIEVIWHTRRKYGKTSGIKSIEEVYEFTANKVVKTPRLMDEIIAFQALTSEKIEFKPITKTERLLAFQNKDGIENIPDTPWNEIFMPYLDLALNISELPKRTDKQLVMTALIAIFNGMPLLARQYNYNSLGKLYKEQLSLLWAGVKSLYS
jgi:AcrR family transcriptional regulator